MRQTEINALLVRRGQLGQRVVRLKGGDPLIFGRGGEEVEALLEAGVAFEIVPGRHRRRRLRRRRSVIPLTHRDHAKTLILVTGHTKDGEPELNWQALCQPGQTLVFYMGHKALDRLCARLIEHGLPATLPAALIENGTLPSERRVRATLATLAAEVERAGPLQGPALLIIGEVVAFADPHPAAPAPGRPSCTRPTALSELRAATAGLCATLVGIGLARFAYTPLLPALIEGGWFSPPDAAYLAAANLVGYLVGAIGARPVMGRMRPTWLVRLMMLLASCHLLRLRAAAGLPLVRVLAVPVRAQRRPVDGGGGPHRARGHPRRPARPHRRDHVRRGRARHRRRPARWCRSCCAPAWSRPGSASAPCPWR